MPKLGFGLMRLPEKDGVIDHEQLCRMVDSYMDAGMNYFDTAYIYHGGNSETAAREALVKRYPR
ncbi:MAG: aldo/keto reductase, partial [Lachnospiraceae bacterium]|nr:aldo/keto reductase [Lachnospiraceae bacterium]